MTRAIGALFAGTAVIVLWSPQEAQAEDMVADSRAAATTASITDPASLSAICTDRPTKSNVACTVDEGHFQYESDLFNGTFLRQGGLKTDTYLATNPTLKYGLSKTVDLEVNIAPYEFIHTSEKVGDSTTLGGIGDLYLRLKYNFYNSVDGKLSVAVIPYVKAPTARLGLGNGAVEGGALLPTDYKLTDQITLAAVPEVDVFKNSTGDGRHLNTAQLINIGYSLPNNITIYAELWGDWNFDPLRTVRQYSADVAISWGLTKYLQIDVGLNFGLNDETPAVQPYFGVSQKF